MSQNNTKINAMGTEKQHNEIKIKTKFCEIQMKLMYRTAYYNIKNIKNKNYSILSTN